MTLQDLWLMIKHYSRWVVLVPIICGVLAGGAGALLGMVNGSVPPLPRSQSSILRVW